LAAQQQQTVSDTLHVSTQLQLLDCQEEAACCQAEHEQLLHSNAQLTEACKDIASEMLRDQSNASQEVELLCDVEASTIATAEGDSALQQENFYLQEQNRHLLKAKQRMAALMEENRRLQDKLWRLSEIEQKSMALQAEVHRLHAENRLLCVSRQKAVTACHPSDSSCRI